ncbi:MFS transporter [Leptolyngbya sp. NIES-2104]|uniref:MFS transporter n=1 Tax=Leptolyngbya sp. NIES-2104 TaxID=1552121 RepID=UPI0006EC5ECD|nr:MFS transporter [Leptolyngbya sp. NIES-2104]GAP94100.1 MFS permease [Leptolyngbya sp. NIES-2104]
MKQSSTSRSVQLILLLVSTLTAMSNATISPSLPVMREHFSNVENVDYLVRLALTIPSLFVAIAAPFAGLLIDQLGRKPLLATGLLIYGIAGSSGLWLNSLYFLLIGRAFLGLSVAGIMTTATTLISDYYTGAFRARLLSWQSAAMALGGVVFLSFGGLLADVSWRLPFLIYLVALLLLPAVLLLLPEPNRERSSASDQTSSEPATLPIGLIVFTYAIALITQAAFYMIPVQLPFYLRELTNATASQSGMAIAVSTLFVAASSFLYQRLKARFTFVSIYEMAFLSMGVGYGVIALANGYVVVILGLAIAGFGLGLLMPNMNLCLASITPDQFRGRVLGGWTTCFFLGQFLSPLLSQPLSQRFGLSITYGLTGGVLISLGVATFFVMTRPQRTV